MRLFPNQIKALEEVIDLVVVQGGVLDGELKKKVDFNKKWGSKDRRNFYQVAYDMVRNYELLDYIGKKEDKGVIGAYLASLTEHATDYEVYKNDEAIQFQTRFSLPDSAWKIYEREAPNAQANIRAMQQQGAIFLRINTALISLEAFSEKLNTHEIAHTLITNIQYKQRSFNLNCIQLHQRTQQHRSFFEENQSYYEIQDLGSQIITEFMDFSNATTIIESCAGHGGKTSHILDKTRATNPLIISCDKDKKKLETLLVRIAKWKNHKVVTEQAKDKLLEKYENMADIICMDMPCTGSGTLKRQADIKYRISEKILEERVASQREVFHLFDSTLKSGGQLLYSTCSLFKSENNEQIEYIVSQGYSLEDELLLEPSQYPGDGFYMARLRKKANN
jgi:16S rRNA (cytosine967-C5)-methyltransferase